jgi:hypothetical protein
MLVNIVIRCIPEKTKAISFTDGFKVCDRVADNEYPLPMVSRFVTALLTMKKKKASIKAIVMTCIVTERSSLSLNRRYNNDRSLDVSAVVIFR